jgi:pimeloyl-ACP methyl ester carboxylesterase
MAHFSNLRESSSLHRAGLRNGIDHYDRRLNQPALVVNGNRDLIIYTINSFILQQNLPNAQLIIYPDASHGAPYQYPELFVKHATLFLDA